jgi:tmRNA-binding protein
MITATPNIFIRRGDLASPGVCAANEMNPKFAGKASERGFTLVPTSVYFKNGRAKVEIAVARGKQLHDKRQALKTAEAKREMARAAGRRR